MISSKLLASVLPKAASVAPTLLGAAAPASSTLLHRQMASAAAEATFDTKPYKLHKLDNPIAAQGTLSRDDALLYYRQMMVIRYELENSEW